MSRSDKTLIGIVAGIILLVAAAFLAAFLRPKDRYKPEALAENVVYNYLLALRDRDYGRAYGYLSTTLNGYPPTLDAFIQDIQNSRWEFNFDIDSSIGIDSVTGSDSRKVVAVRQTFLSGGDLFNTSTYSNTFTFTLSKPGEAWKIVDGDQYFSYCWKNTGGCP